ncbi:hypothetical protein TNCV_1055381 [Trichonephila clavipes]|nr:hypothetical protein TNCV_1055381 [Trichonephila clavipes]
MCIHSGVTENIRASLQSRFCAPSRISQSIATWCQALGPTAMRGYSNEDIRLSESDCEESEESADVTDNITVTPDIYVTQGMVQSAYL